LPLRNPQKTAIIKKRKIAIVASLLAVLMIGINFLFLHSAVLFMMVGLLLLGTASLWGDYLVCKNGSVISDRLSSKKMIWSALYVNKKQVLLSFYPLAAGIFIVFSVGLNRPGFENNAQLRSGTGGFSLWGESSIPIYHNMSTQTGREKLSLKTLPDDTEILQCFRLSADDASCLNLNKVSVPNVLGIDMNDLAGSDFHIMENIYSLNRKDIYDRLQVHKNFVYPALVDATVLTWSLDKKLGDTLYYENDKGREIALQLVGTLPNTVFQGHILIDRQLFSEIWKETTGSEVFLVKTDESKSGEVKTLLSQALNEYGVRITTTSDRLKLFNTVTDTYLTIFLTLGGIGLLLGCMSFFIVIRKSLVSRRKQHRHCRRNCGDAR
jgi:putative ABC transport system permease protein